MKRPTRRLGGHSKSLVTRTAARKLLPVPFRAGEGRGEGSLGDERIILTISNRQRTRPINVPLLRQICVTFVNDLLGLKSVELGITLVAAPEMTGLNKTFLNHEGSTDVITFDHAEPGTRNLEAGTNIHGELFVCVDEAVLQARRFRTTWQSEVVRYVIHGILHLLGHDDHRVADRRKMKREENRLLRSMATRFPLSRLARKTRLRS
jgi:probable rRNA maturation factor